MKSLQYLKPVEELGAKKPHGTRLRYMSGCKCVPCRAASSRYESERQKKRKAGLANPIVPADKAREHILKLSDIGIGYKTVADIAGLAPTTVFKIRSGERKNLRRLNEKAILAVDETALPDAALVPAAPVWRMVRWFLREGFSKAELARRLGYKTRALQLNKDFVTAANALKVRKLYNQIRLGE